VSADRGALSELFGLLNVAPQAIAPHATVIAVAHAACLLLGIAPGAKGVNVADGFTAAQAAAVSAPPADTLPAASTDILPFQRPADISSSPPPPPTPRDFIAVARDACACGQLLHPLADADMPDLVDAARFHAAEAAVAANRAAFNVDTAGALSRALRALASMVAALLRHHRTRLALAPDLAAERRAQAESTAMNAKQLELETSVAFAEASLEALERQIGIVQTEWDSLRDDMALKRARLRYGSY
jgi:hypothetical protein